MSAPDNSATAASGIRVAVRLRDIEAVRHSSVVESFMVVVTGLGKGSKEEQ